MLQPLFGIEITLAATTNLVTLLLLESFVQLKCLWRTGRGIFLKKCMLIRVSSWNCSLIPQNRGWRMSKMVPAFPNEKKKKRWCRVAKAAIRFNTNCLVSAVLPHNEVNAFIAMKNSCLKVSKSQKHFFLETILPKKGTEFWLIFRSFFGQWSFKKNWFWDLLTFNNEDSLLFASCHCNRSSNIEIWFEYYRRFVMIFLLLKTEKSNFFLVFKKTTQKVLRNKITNIQHQLRYLTCCTHIMWCL